MSDKKDNFGDDVNANATDFSTLFENSMQKVHKALKAGDKIKGEILTIGKEEVFVTTGTLNDGSVPRRDLLNAEGLLPYKVGDVVDLFVTSVRGSQITLSPKPTSKNLAEGLEDAYDMMLPVDGKVTEVVNGGFRVQLTGSKLAFCPISQLDSKRIDKPEEYIGKKFDFLITKWEGGRNIVVSRRKLMDEERELNQSMILEDMKPGKIVDAKITRLEKFGAFAEIASQVEGLVHISEIKWIRLEHPSEALQVGQMVKTKILKVEDDGGRLKISLSIKQAEEADASSDPWSTVSIKFPVGTIITGKVTRREPYGLFVQIAPGITGLLPKSKANENPTFPFEKLKVGDSATIQVNEINAADRRISLGVPADPDAEGWKDFKQSTNTNMGTLGDQFKNLFNKK